MLVMHAYNKFSNMENWFVAAVHIDITFSSLNIRCSSNDNDNGDEEGKEDKTDSCTNPNFSLLLCLQTLISL